MSPHDALTIFAEAAARAGQARCQPEQALTHSRFLVGIFQLAVWHQAVEQARAPVAFCSGWHLRGGRCHRTNEGKVKRHRLLPHRGKRSEEHTSELQSLMRISYAVFCLITTSALNPYVLHHKSHTNTTHH